MTARFISLEGGEGVGKSTQARALAAAIRARGHAVVETREPGGSPGAEAIRRLLLEGVGDRWSVEAEALLFAAARADHVARTVRPAIVAGSWVVCDRFVDSSRAYQGIVGGLTDDAVMKLHQVGSAGLLPDRTLFLALDPDEGIQRTVRRDQGDLDRFGGRDARYHGTIDDAFWSLAQDDPQRFRIVDAQGSPEEVTSRLLAAIADLL